MMDEQQDFLEGFLAATRILSMQSADDRPGSAAGYWPKNAGWQERIAFCGEMMALDDYLEVPTFLRRGCAVDSLESFNRKVQGRN